MDDYNTPTRRHHLGLDREPRRLRRQDLRWLAALITTLVVLYVILMLGWPS